MRIVVCDHCGKEFKPNMKDPVVYDHGKRYCIECYAEVCRAKIEARPFNSCLLTLRISRRRFAGWWASTRLNWQFIVFWVVLFTLWYCWPTEG